jgi:hypothetical protein
MGERVKSSTISGFAAAVATVLVLCAGPAWAGGASDAGALQTMLCTITGDLGILGITIPCPQYPTYTTGTPPSTTPFSPATPIALELAAWENVTPDSLRILDSDCTPFGTLAGGLYCSQLAVNATNPPAKSPLSDAEDAQIPAGLSSLQSLAFVSNPAPKVPLTVTQNLDPKATSQVYAVTEPANGQPGEASAVALGTSGQPNTLDLFFSNLKSTSAKGQVVATIAFPLAVLVNGATTENSIVATLHITGPTATVSADLGMGMGKQVYSPSDLGLNFESFSVPSPKSSSPNTIYELQIPLLVNPQTDPFYFLNLASLPQCPNGINQISGYCNAFSATNPPNGFAPKHTKKTPDFVVGMAPSAAPQCPGAQPGTMCPATLPTNPKQPLSPTFGFCASFSGNLNNPDATFFLAIAPDGTTYVSSPVAPALSGAPYPACPSS